MDLVRAIWAAGALLVPGLLAARAIVPDGGRVERVALGCALGRIALALVTLGGGAIGTPSLAMVWSALAWGAGVPALLLLPGGGPGWRARGDASTRLGVVTLLVAALAVAVAVVGRSGTTAPDGSLVFFGRDATHDTLVYAALAAQAGRSPLPLPNPFAAGVANLGHSLFFAELAGLGRASGLGVVDVAFRLRPILDLAALVVTAFALARRLGGTPLGATLGGLLVLLGGGLSQPLFGIARAAGVRFNELELWAYGTSFLVPFNPLAPGAQTAWSALLLLGAPAGGARARGRAVVAGLLVASVFELKATLWISLLPALGLAAWRWRATEGGRAAGVAAAVATVASLPLLAASPGVLPAEGELAPASIRFCLACLPRFAVASAFQDPFAMKRLIEGFDVHALLDARFWLGSAAASAVYLLVTLGARLLAYPVRAGAIGAPAGASGAGVAASVLGLSLALGAAATCVLDTPPHFLNAGQFAWCAALGTWILLGVRLGRWAAAGRRGRAALAVALVLALPSGLWWIVRGATAPAVDRVSAAERALALAAAREVPDDAVLLDPTLLVDPARASPLAWLAGRRLYASKEGMVAYLPPDERARRLDRLRRIYRSPQRDTAEAALAETGVRYLVTTGDLGAGLAGSAALRALYRNDAGTLWEVLRR